MIAIHTCRCSIFKKHTHTHAHMPYRLYCVLLLISNGLLQPYYSRNPEARRDTL